MLSDRDRRSLNDILCNIDLASSFVEGLDAEGFAADLKSFYAVTRCLEIVSEASRRLSPEFKTRHPEIPWRSVAGSGNVYRHNDEGVARQVIWRTVHEALPPSRALVLAELPPT